MKNTLFPLLIAGALLADVAPGGCGKRSERPLPTQETPPPADGTTGTPDVVPASPSPTDNIPAPPAY